MSQMGNDIKKVAQQNRSGALGIKPFFPLLCNIYPKHTLYSLFKEFNMINESLLKKFFLPG